MEPICLDMKERKNVVVERDPLLNYRMNAIFQSYYPNAFSEDISSDDLSRETRFAKLENRYPYMQLVKGDILRYTKLE